MADDTSGRVPAMMVAIFAVMLASYIIYIMLLSPWERKALLTKEASITVNVIDCESGYPINGAKVSFYKRDGKFLQESETENGRAIYRGLADCYRVKSSFDYEQNISLCIGSGEHRILNFCYKYPEANPQVIYYIEELGLVGGSAGEVVSNNNLTNAVVSFPLSNTSTTYPSSLLYSNLLWSEGMGIQLSSIDKNLTKSINFKFKINDIKGNPDVKVYANNRLILNTKASKDEVIITELLNQELNETINLEVKCDFAGIMFWTTQYCEITDTVVTQEFYTPSKVTHEITFTTTEQERFSEITELKFINAERTPSGITASINDYEIFNSNTLIAGQYNTTSKTENLNLKRENNTLIFEAKPGAEAYLRGIQLSFKAGNTQFEEKEFNFRISEQEMNELSNAVINLFINDVYVNGQIKVKVNNVYYVYLVDRTGWNEIKILKEDLQSNNQVIISADEGRYGITQVIITHE